MAAKAKEIFNDLNLVLRLNQHIEELTADEASRAALLSKETSFKVLAELAALETPDPREDAQFDHQRTGFGDAAALPFHLQGDHTFNEASALARRRQLRHSEAIKTKIQFLWQVARGRKAAEQLTRVAANSDRLRKLSGTSASAAINEREYTEMMLLIFKVLRDDFVLETAQRQIQCDWEVDSHHGSALSYEQFFAALFELVDVWTCDILEATYARFLELLTRRITVRVVVFLDDMKLKLALSDNFDEAVVVKAIPLCTIKQFASVAKVMEGTGVRTVGELAAADPRAVETQRARYLERIGFSQDKIGGDLQHLLDMFREISGQFHDANYSLQNMVLQRIPPANRGAGDYGDDYVRSPTEVGKASDGKRSCRDSGPRQAGAESLTRPTLENSHVLDIVDNSSTAMDMKPPRPHANDIIGGKESTGRHGSEANAVLRRGGFKRINTLHDITATDTGVIDAIKATFLIEKGISIQRKTSLASVETELVKFGVNTKGMDESAMREKYDTLYETFVLRDGDNIKALAQSILARIKMELSAHGVEVNEDEMEATYDDFYGSVVAGNGERIVADAKSWVDETLSSNSYGSYVKQEYHELKSIDEVRQLGSGADDEEFVSLLSKEVEGDEEEEEDEDDSKGVGSSPPYPGGETPSAPLSRRPSLYRGSSLKPQRNGEALSWPTEDPLVETAAIPGPTSPRSTLSSTLPDVISIALSENQLVSNQMADDRDTCGLDSALNSIDETDSNSFSDEKTVPLDELLSQLPQQPDSTTGFVTFNEEATIDIQVEGSDLVAPGEKSVSVGVQGAGVDQSDLLEDGYDLRRRSIEGLKQSRSNPDVLDGDAMSSIGGNHTDLNEFDREPQGVEFGYEEKGDERVIEVIPVTPEGPTIQTPKVPDIVIGGVDSAKNIAVTARYIQLLGLGNVTTVFAEDELLAMLSSSPSIDLLCFDISDELDRAVAHARALVDLVGRCVILFGGDANQPEKNEVIARLCVTEGGAVYFATLPLDFPALRSVILTFFDSSPHRYIIRQRRPTAVFGAAAKLVSTSIRATNMISVEDDHPRSILTPPLSVDNNSAKRKATATSTPGLPLPQVSAAKREVFTPFRPLRIIDEMPGAEMAIPARFSPVVPSTHAYKTHQKSPRMSAALKKLMR